MTVVATLGFLGIFSFGFLISDAIFGKKTHILERVSVGFLLGSGIFTFILFLANWWLTIPFKTVYSLLILLFLNIIALVINILAKRMRKEKELFDYHFNFGEEFEKLNVIEKITVGLTLFLFLSSLIHNIYWPVTDWDALAVYDFRAKTFVITGFMQDAITRGYFTGYPLYTSIIHTFLYLLNFKNPVFIYTLIYISLILTLFFVIYKISGKRLFSLVFALFISINSALYGHSIMSYTNLPYTVFLAVGFAYLIYSFHRKLSLTYFYAGILLISLSSWVRASEPFWLLGVSFVIIFLIYSKKAIHVLSSLAILYLPRFLWFKFLSNSKIIEGSYDTGALSATKGLISNFLNLDQPKIISYFYNNMLLPYNALLLAFLASLILLIYFVFVKKMVKFNLRDDQSIFIFLPSALVILSILIMLLGIYIFMFLFGDYAFQIAGSAERSSMPLIVFLLFSISINLFYILKFLAQK